MIEVREQIKQSFFIDQLQLKDGPQMTATEVNARTDEHLRLLGPILGRMHHELLAPLIARVIGIIKRERDLLPPDMPAELGNINLEVFYNSQIAKAQRIAEGQNLDRAIVQVTPFLQADPTVMDNLDLDQIVRYSFDLNGVPAELFRDGKEVEQIREERATIAAREQQEQSDLNEAEVLSKVAPLQGA